MQPALRITLAASSSVPEWTGGPFSVGVAKLTTGASASGWSRDYIVSIGDVGERVDLSQGGNYAQLLDCDICLSNHDGWMGLAEDDDASLIGALVEVGTISGTTFTAVWSGTVADALMDEASVALRCESILAARHKDIPVRALTSAELPGLPADSEGAIVPIVYGPMERINGPTLLADKDFLTAMSVREVSGDYALTSGYLATMAGVPASTVNTLHLVMAVYLSSGDPYLPGYLNSDIPTHYYVEWAVNGNHNLYISVESGTGSGQDRKIGTFSGYSAVSSGDYTILYSIIGLAAPLDTMIDTTSRVNVYSRANGASIIVADECTVSGVTADVNGVAYPLAFVQSSPVNGVQSADASAEFRAGEDYAALQYFFPSDVRGVESLRDGLSASGGENVQAIPYRTGAVTWDSVCWAEFDAPAMAKAIGRNDAELYVFFSSAVGAGTQALFCQAWRWDGTLEIPIGAVSQGNSMNNYPQSIEADGTPGMFGIYPVGPIALAMPIEAYRKIRLSMMPRLNTATIPLASGANVDWVNGQNWIDVNGIDFGFPPSISRLFRPEYLTEDTGAVGYASVYSGNPYDWMDVFSVVDMGPGPGGYGEIYRITFVDPWEGPSGSFPTFAALPADFVTCTQTEIGLGAMYGAIPQDTTFAATVSSGRKYSAAWPALPAGKANGDPILLARDAVLDMYYRDLGLVAAQVDFDSFQDLPADAIVSALMDRINSAQRVADLCAQFNWVISHDLDGRETARSLFDRVNTTAHDYTFDTSDMVAGSINGRDLTDIQDLVNIPSINYDWTPSDKFRQTAHVSDCVTDPETLISSNYLQHISGFGDLSASVEAYRALYSSHQINKYQRAATVEYPDAGAGAMGLFSPSRMEWMASRKYVLRFNLSESYSSGAPIVGRRAMVRHKRYTRNAWMYGTIVESAWSTDSAIFSVTVMIDPTPLYQSNLFVDSLDDDGIDWADDVTVNVPDVVDSLEVP